MWNLSKMLSAFWGILGLITLVTLFIVYASFPEYVNQGFLLDHGIQLDRQRFFFIFSGLYLAVNLITYIAIKTTGSLKKGSRALSAIQHLRTMVSLKILVIGANLFLVMLMIFVSSAIGGQGNSSSWYLPLLWVGPLVMVAGLSYLIFTMLFPAREG